MTLEEAKLVDKFMGEDYSCSFDEYTNYDDWNNLMQVVEKIEEVSFDSIESDYVPYTKNPFTVNFNYMYAKITVDNDFKLENIHKAGIVFNEYNEESKLIACQKAILEFINWYNNQKHD